jgi:hypothetical protein
MLVPVALLLCAGESQAQSDAEAAARRGALERQQQSETFSLQLQHSQQKLQLRPESGERLDLDALHLEQQHRQEMLQQEQLRQLTPASPGYDEARSERQRRAQSFEFGTQVPSWGPRLDGPRRWTPTLDPPRRE